MPSVKKGQTRNQYVSYCVPYVMKEEGLDRKAAVGKCEGMYTQYLKNKKSKGFDIVSEVAEEIIKQNGRETQT